MRAFDRHDGESLIRKKVRSDVSYGVITGVCDFGVCVTTTWISFDDLRRFYEKYNKVLKRWEKCEKM